MKKHFKLNYHLIYETELKENSFLIDNVETNVPCVFQIWKYKEGKRLVPPKLSPINFKFVKKDNILDISFRRVCVYAGKISTDIKDKSIQSHYFIKFTNNKKIENNINSLSNINFNTNNTVGPKSISKQELIKEFNSVL
jgi:hypothetical protein